MGFPPGWKLNVELQRARRLYSCMFNVRSESKKYEEKSKWTLGFTNFFTRAALDTPIWTFAACCEMIDTQGYCVHQVLLPTISPLFTFQIFILCEIEHSNRVHPILDSFTHTIFSLSNKQWPQPKALKNGQALSKSAVALDLFTVSCAFK